MNNRQIFESTMSVYNSIDSAEDESHQIISSYFLGPKAENYDFFQKRLNDILEAQRDARLDYFPKDGKFISGEVQSSAAYRGSVRKMTNAVREASRLFAKHSIPFWYAFGAYSAQTKSDSKQVSSLPRSHVYGPIHARRFGFYHDAAL